MPTDKQYITKLSPGDEATFQTWVKNNRIPFDPSPQADYDMRGFWKALKANDPRATTAINPSDNALHFPDTWKTPYHRTFSNESIYAPPDAPRWINDRLVRKDGTVIADESIPQVPGLEEFGNVLPKAGQSPLFNMAQEGLFQALSRAFK